MNNFEIPDNLSQSTNFTKITNSFIRKHSDKFVISLESISKITDISHINIKK